MKETKVYVDELPIQCIDCQFAYSGKCQLNGEIYCIENCRRSDCPLIDIKTHNRELVKEVCEKIKNKVENLTNIVVEENNFDTITGHGLKQILDQIQELEGEDENTRK